MAMFQIETQEMYLLDQKTITKLYEAEKENPYRKNILRFMVGKPTITEFELQIRLEAHFGKDFDGKRFKDALYWIDVRVTIPRREVLILAG